MRKHILFLFHLLVFCQLKAQAINANAQRLAADSYDLVSYQSPDGPKKGTKQHAVLYQGYHYLFASQENKSRFESAPDQYLPAFGGWCAYAMAKGEKVAVNPLAYTIENGQLYLFYKTILVDTRNKWLKNNEALKKSAEKHWANLIEPR